MEGSPGVGRVCCCYCFFLCLCVVVVRCVSGVVGVLEGGFGPPGFGEVWEVVVFLREVTGFLTQKFWGFGMIQGCRSFGPPRFFLGVTGFLIQRFFVLVDDPEPPEISTIEATAPGPRSSGPQRFSGFGLVLGLADS